MHVRRPQRHAAQARCPERALQLRVVFSEEPKLLTLSRTCIAVAPKAIEFIAPHSGNGGGAPRIRPFRVARRYAGVVKMLVGEQGSVVATHTVALADEKPQTAHLLWRQGGRAFAIVAQQLLYVAIQTRGFVLQTPLIRGDGLSH